MITFQKEITFINPAGWDDTEKKHIEKEERKAATFKEFSRTDREQREFQFMVTSIIKSNGSTTIVDHKVLCDITEQFIEINLILDASFTAQDKLQFLNDNIAIIDFALWLLKEKITPFFALLGKNLIK